MTVKPRPEPTESEVFEVWDINAPVLDLFLAAQGSWRVLATGFAAPVWLGLDLTAVDVLMRRGGIEDENGEIFAGLQIMEGAAIAAFAEAR